VSDRTVFNPPESKGEHIPRYRGQPLHLALVDDHEIVAAHGKYW